MARKSQNDSGAINFLEIQQRRPENELASPLHRCSNQQSQVRYSPVHQQNCDVAALVQESDQASGFPLT
jgi:hypothetical protein